MADYYWITEQVDGNPADREADIVDVVEHAGRKAAEAYATGRADMRVALVREAWSGEREWAYLRDGKLPEHFENAFGNEGSKVPARFIRHDR